MFMFYIFNLEQNNFCNGTSTAAQILEFNQLCEASFILLKRKKRTNNSNRRPQALNCNHLI